MSQELPGQARHMIKWEMPQESWQEFGIADLK